MILAVTKGLVGELSQKDRGHEEIKYSHPPFPVIRNVGAARKINILADYLRHSDHDLPWELLRGAHERVADYSCDHDLP